MIVHFTIPGPPVGKGRPRFNRATGRAYTPERTASYENLVRMAFCQQYPQWMVWSKDRALRMEIAAYYPPPSSISKKRREFLLAKGRPTKKPDASNLLKSIEDALNGVAYEDDSSIAEVHVWKYYGEPARAEVTIEPL